MAAAGAGHLRRAASALLLPSPRLPVRELSAPARLYHKKVRSGEGVGGVRIDQGAGMRGPSLRKSGHRILRGLGSPHYGQG